MGNVANYIPELDKAQKDALGILLQISVEINFALEIGIQNLLFKVFLR